MPSAVNLRSLNLDTEENELGIKKKKKKKPKFTGAEEDSNIKNW